MRLTFNICAAIGAEMSTDEREKQIREREAKATKGPWEVMPDSVIQYMNRIWADGCNENFIAHARADIPWLLSQLEELRTDIALRRAGAERLESELEGTRREIEAFKKGSVR